MVHAVPELMGRSLPELIENEDRVAEIIEGEETRFAHTLDIGTATTRNFIERYAERTSYDHRRVFMRRRGTADNTFGARGPGNGCLAGV